MLKKIGKVLKNNKYTTVGIIIFILLVILGFAVYRFLFPNIGSPVYGNRLDGIEAVEFTKDQNEEIEAAIKEKEFVNSVSCYVKGKIYNVVVEVKEATSANDAKGLTAVVLEKIEERQRKYFDIQVFFSNENEEAAGYPIIGYLNKGSEAFFYSESK